MLSCILHPKGNNKRLFEQFFERMSDLTRSHVEAELCFDLVSHKHVVNAYDGDDKYNAVLIR